MIGQLGDLSLPLEVRRWGDFGRVFGEIWGESGGKWVFWGVLGVFSVVFVGFKWLEGRGLGGEY